MNKKNIGAALSVVAAVTAGATVYASTINNLESDKNTNSMITPYYADTTYDYYSLVKSDYTEDLKNTTIANEKRVVQNTNETRDEIEKIEKAAQQIVATTINVTTPVKETPAEVVTEETVIADEVEEVVENVVYEPEYEPEVVEEVETAEEDIVVYDDTNLDEVLVDNTEEELEVAEEVVEPENTYLEENQVVNETVTRYINTEALNVRSSKDMTNPSNIVRTFVAGTEVTGTIEGDWLKTNEGYLALAFLSETKPQTLVEEQNTVEETTEEVAQPVVEEVTEVIEQPVVEEKANEVVQEVKQEVKGQAFTGWVYNTKVLNVRDAAKTGNIIGTLPTAHKVAGEIIDGWVKFDYNGKTAYVSAAYLSTTEPVVEQQNEPAAEPAKPEVEEVVYEEEVVVEEAPVEEAVVEQAAPVLSQNGQQVANIASQYAGHPYVWGSSNPAVGFDCSGLVVNAYRQLGVSLPHSSAAQYSSGYAVNSANLQPGDLVFFKIRGGGIDHVGIITSSDGTFIHASTPATGVVYDNVYNNHYQKSFVGARRIF